MSFLCTIASGSTGNAALLSDGTTHLLIDAGVSFRKITEGLKRFDLKPDDLSAVIITHEHNDHIKGLELLCRRTELPVYLSVGTAYSLEKAVPCLHNTAMVFYAGDAFEIGGIGVETFSTPHDAADSVGFLFHSQGCRIGYATDLGYITTAVHAKLLGADSLFLESNHDLFSLLQGPYPEHLKRRILGRRGHLSNDDCADFVVEAVRRGARKITLCHLSQHNNTPELASCKTLEMLSQADPGRDYSKLVCVAPPDGVGVPFLY